MRHHKAFARVFGRVRDKRGCPRPAARRARPFLEGLENRIALSVGGGWINSTEFGQSGDGLLGQFYNNSTLSGTPSFTQWDNRVDSLWTAGNADPGGSSDPSFASVGPDNWSAEWTGVLTANFSETYTFVINSAGNGVRLWVAPLGQQGNPIINDWTNHGQLTDTATMTLQAGQQYAVELDLSETTATVQQIQLQWSSPSTPLEDIEPVTQVGLNVEGGDALFANMVNSGTRNTWWSPVNSNVTVPTDSNLWPEGDATIFLGEGDTTTEAGGSYLVQFNGMATVNDTIGQSIDWWVNGTDLHSSTLQAGQGYNPITNTTTATMVVSPSNDAGFYMQFTNTSRTSESPMAITAITDPNANVTVSVPSVAGMAQNEDVTITGFTGSSAPYNGTYVITSVNTSNNTFTFTATNYAVLPANGTGGTALVNPQNGITNLYVMQPTTLGGNTPIAVGTLFTPAALSMVSQYTVLRLMDLNDTNGNLTSNWSDRSLVGDNFWSAYTFNSGTGVDTGVSNISASGGVPWEVQIALANESGKDIYINIPSNVSTSYITNLANLFAYGSNGVTPYTSVQSDPVWKPLNSNLKVYIEFSNETWNSGFVQAESRWDGWANQLSQRALYDYLTNNQNDPLYPGGGSNAYNDGAILAAYYNANPGNDSGFLATYNANPAPSTDGGSPVYFSNASSFSGYTIGQGWIGLRDVQISNAFKAAFGETNVNAADTDSRVRPVFEWQYGGSYSGALGLISGVYGAQHPVSYYLYGGGGGWYAENDTGGFSDVSFANPAFANGLTGWTASGSAGVVANGSSMGNPAAPPLFSAISLTNGATESGNTVTITTTEPHNFVVGQSVLVSAVNANGYNGTFTITSVTSTTFTYQDSAAGLGNSAGGIVTGTGPSTQTAYLQPGASLSQNVTFSDGYADIALYATENYAFNYTTSGLSITLTPTNGGPTINNGQPIPGSEGAALYSSNQGAFIWARTEAFYTGASDYTYTVTFTNANPSGTIFFDNVAIQTVNGIFNETSSRYNVQTLTSVQSDVALALQYNLHDVGYEGGYLFDQNMAGYMAQDGYASIAWEGYSSSVPNVGMYANLDPRTEPLAIASLDAFYAAGGTLPIVFESSGNINSWAVAAPTYFNWDTPKLQAAASVEQTSHPATYGLAPGQSGTSNFDWLTGSSSLDSTYLVPLGVYTLTMRFQPQTNVPAGVIDPVEVFIDGQLTNTVNWNVQTEGSFTVLVGSLAAGQHSVLLFNAAPASNPWLNMYSPGFPVYTLNYAGPTTPATPSITWPAPANITYGVALGSGQLDAIANVPGTFTYAQASGTILNAGNDQTLSVTFTPTDTTDYTTVTGTTNINVLEGTPAITWPNPANIVSGTVLSGAQLDATSSWTVAGVSESVAGTFTYTPAVGTVLAVGNNQTLSVTFTPNDSTDFTSATATVEINVTGSSAASPASAAFVNEDTATQGNWEGVYGSQGYDIVSGPSSLPSYATVTPSGESVFDWSTAIAPQSLELPNSSNRIAAVWYSGTSFTVDVDLTDGQTHDLELYFLNYDGKGRSEQVQIKQYLRNLFCRPNRSHRSANGVYLDWQVSRSEPGDHDHQHRLAQRRSSDGLFIDPTTSTTATYRQLQRGRHHDAGELGGRLWFPGL